MESKSQPTIFKRVRARLYLWSGRIHRHYGIVHADRNEFVSAIEDYGKAVKMNPSLDIAYLERGTILWRELGRATHAIRDLTFALNSRPNWPDALFNRALAYQAAGNYEAAMDDFSSYLEQGDDRWRHDAASQLQQIRALFDGKNTSQGNELS